MSPLAMTRPSIKGRSWDGAAFSRNGLHLVKVVWWTSMTTMVSVHQPYIPSSVLHQHTSPQLFTTSSISAASPPTVQQLYRKGRHPRYTHAEVGPETSLSVHYFSRVYQATSALNLSVCCSQTHAQELPFLQRLATMCDELYVACFVLPRQLSGPWYKHDPMQ